MLNCEIRFWDKLFLTILLMFIGTFSVNAQDMRVENFRQLKKKFLGKKNFDTDKTQAILDIYTTEKGFTFKANGKEDASPKEETDDHITLLLPSNTRYIQIKHGKFGELAWKIPPEEKLLKKKKHYQCDLIAIDPDKVNKIDKQWAVFYVNPENAILHIDSTRYNVRNGKIQVYLPVGKHVCKFEAPFYQEWKGEVCIYDSIRANLQVNMQPAYSYLTVKSPLKGCKILLDGDSIGETQTSSNRLAAGRYRLTLVRNNLCYYNKWVDIKTAEKKVVVLTEKDMHPMQIPASMTMTQLAETPPTQESAIEAPAPAKPTYGMLNIESNVVDAEIFINGKMSCKTPAILNDIPANQNCEVMLKKKGYKDCKQSVFIRSNELNSLSLYMKKKK